MFFLLRRFSAYLRRGWEEIFESEREGDIIPAGCWIGSVFVLGPAFGFYVGDLLIGPSRTLLTDLSYPFILVGFAFNFALVRELVDRAYFKVSPLRGFGIGLAGGFDATIAAVFIFSYLL